MDVVESVLNKYGTSFYAFVRIMLCWSLNITCLQVNAIHSILYASEDDNADADAQAMVSQQQNHQQPTLSPILEASEERPKQEAAHKRKSISDPGEFEMAASSSRPRLSDISDVQLCGSPLTSFT